MLNLLNQTFLFQDLEFQELDKIACFCKRLELLDGEIIIQEYDRRNADLYLLCDGSVEIVSNNCDSISNEVVISKHQKEILGEVGWLIKNQRTATVRCRGPVEVIQVDGTQLKKYLDKDSLAGYHVMRRIALLLAKRLEQADTLLKQILWNGGL